MKKLAVITTYYNPSRYQTRRKNFEVFKRGVLAAGVALLTVECVFGDEAPELPEGPDVLHVQSQSVLWQKERLLNLAAAQLPADVDAVAWIDADLLFSNPRWAQDTLQALKHSAVVQMFETCTRLDQSGEVGDHPDVVESMASVMRRFPQALGLQRYDIHGHTGYAWAMRRELFDKVGLYEHAISGSADHFMAHAIFGDCGFCVQNALKHDPVQISHFQEWARRFYVHTQGRLGVVPGHIVHLWHGDLKHRNYFNRMHLITELGYNPYTDLHIVPGRPLEWASHLKKPGLVAYFKEFFDSRLEDGASGTNTTAAPCCAQHA